MSGSVGERGAGKDQQRECEDEVTAALIDRHTHTTEEGWLVAPSFACLLRLSAVGFRHIGVLPLSQSLSHYSTRLLRSFPVHLRFDFYLGCGCCFLSFWAKVLFTLQARITASRERHPFTSNAKLLSGLLHGFDETDTAR